MQAIFLITAIVILAISLMISVYFNFKHGVIIVNMIETIEETLDILDEKYRNVNEILEIPIFYDSPQIRDVCDNIKDCRDAILQVAFELGSVDEIDTEQK